MSLGPYPSEVKGIADELLSLLRDEPLRSASLAVLERRGLEGIAAMSEEEFSAAEKLLSKTPSQRDKALARLGGETAAHLILQARYIGLVAAQVLHFAGRFEFVRGMGYREAAGFAAREAKGAKLAPSREDLFP